MRSKRKKKAKSITVDIEVPTAHDLVTVLEKFSLHKQTLLQPDQEDQCSRLLALNLFREKVRAKLRGDK